VSGTIECFDGVESVLIVRPDGSDHSVKFSIEALGTRVRRNNKDIVLEALQPGQRVTVEFGLKRWGYNVAITVSLAAASNPGAAK